MKRKAGSWAIPFKTQDAKELEMIVRRYNKPNVNIKKLKNEVYEYLGDDELFDKLDGLDEIDSYPSVFIIERLKELLDQYKEAPDTFSRPFEPEALHVLERICGSKTGMNYEKILEAFQKDAEKVGQDKNSVEQFKLWVEAHKQVQARELPVSVINLTNKLRVLIDACYDLDYILRGAPEEGGDGMPGIPVELEDTIYNENMDETGLEHSFDEELGIVTNVCYQWLENIKSLSKSESGYKKSSKESAKEDAKPPKYKEKLKDIQKSREKMTQEEKDKVWETMGGLAKGREKKSEKEVRASDALESDVQLYFSKLLESIWDLKEAGKLTKEQYMLFDGKLYDMEQELIRIYNENIQGA